MSRSTLDEKTLEPRNGDYIAYLKEIEAGIARTQGLTITVEKDTPGMLTVERTGSSATAGSPGAVPKAPVSKDKILVGVGSLVAGVGVLLIIAGMSIFSLNQLIPVGMFAAFGGLVVSLSARKRLERKAREEQNKEG